MQELGPNSLDMQGVGSNQTVNGLAWNCYDRLMSYAAKTLPDAVRNFPNAIIVRYFRKDEVISVSYNAGGVHLVEHFFPAEPVGPMRRTSLWLRPGAIRAFRLPEMDLNIRHPHFHPAEII